jgi:phosphoserine aminotransferase
MKKYNFNAGPSILPEFTIQETVKAIQDLNGSGLSIMEISHRSKDFEAILAETVSLFKELLNIPEGYSVLFLGGGASMQFCMIPYNFLNTKAAYLNTGTWASKALKEAKLFGEVIEVASLKAIPFRLMLIIFTLPPTILFSEPKSVLI